jgi:hypothetical protein
LGVLSTSEGVRTPKRPLRTPMSNPTNKLTDKAVKGAKPGPKPVKLFDGDGLFLLVQAGGENGSKRWRLKYRFGGKEKLLALGTYPEVKLKEARERRDAARTDGAQTVGGEPGMSAPGAREMGAKRAKNASQRHVQAPIRSCQCAQAWSVVICADLP